MIYFFILIIFEVLIPISVSIKYRCPTDEKTITQLSPCYCGQEYAQSAWKVSVVCKSFVDYQRLNDSLQALDDYRIDELTIYGSNIKYLPKSVFKKGRVEIKTISIIASIVEDVADDNSGGSFFDNLSASLKVLRVEWSKGIGSWNWQLVANSLNDTTATKPSALEEIYLFKNDMSGVLRSNFDSMSNNFTTNDDLRADFVAANRNRTRGLQPIRVIIRQNGLKFIDATLSGFKSMQVLDLSWNALDRTRSLFASGIPYNLQTLYLNNNKLTKLLDYEIIWVPAIASSDNIWATANLLEYADYRGNKINCTFTVGTATSITNFNGLNGEKLTIDGVCYSPMSARYKSLMSALTDSST